MVANCTIVIKVITYSILSPQVKIENCNMSCLFHASLTSCCVVKAVNPITQRSGGEPLTLLWQPINMRLFLLSLSTCKQ